MKQKTRRTIENRLRVNEFVQACTGTLPVPILTVTCDRNVLSMNAAGRHLFGIPAGDVGNPVLTDLLMMEDDRDSAIAEVCRKLNSVFVRVKIHSSSGTRDVNCTAVPFMGEDEDVILVTMLFSEPTGNDGSFPEGYAGQPLVRQTSTGILESMSEWEETLLAFSHGDLRTFPPAGIQDPLARLKYLYNEGIAAVQKMVSVKDLFG